MMGLDFRHLADRPSHECPRWAYSGFSHFRELLAAAEGFALNDMQGFSTGNPFKGTRVPGTRSWDEITTSIKPLLDHPDDDGELTPAECAQVAPRLREIATGWDPDPDLSRHRHRGLLLADCMDMCARLGTDLWFR
jgi:hypothetical protein